MATLKLDRFTLISYGLRFFAGMVFFFILTFLAHGATFPAYDKGILTQSLIMLSIGIVLLALLPLVIADRLPENDRKTGILFILAAVSLLVLLWGYLQLFRACGLDTVRTLVLLADALTVGFVLVIRKLAKSADDDRRRVMIGGSVAAVVLGIIAGIDHFVLGVAAITPWIKAQLVVILLFAFAIQSQQSEKVKKTAPKPTQKHKKKK